MDTVSIAAFDRMSRAFMALIKEDAQIIDDLNSANEQLIAGANKAWRDVEKEILENGELKNKIERLLDLCEQQEIQADKFRCDRSDAQIYVSEIRVILES